MHFRFVHDLGFSLLAAYFVVFFRTIPCACAHVMRLTSVAGFSMISVYGALRLNAARMQLVSEAL